MPPVLDGVDHISLPVHLFKVFGETLIEKNFFEEPV